MNYRLALYEDLDEICFMINKAIKEMESHKIYQWDEHYPTRQDFEYDIKESTLYLAYEEERLAAIYAISNECDEEYSKFMWEGSDEDVYIIHRLCVSPDFQHKGIGKKVLLHIEKQLKDIGCKSVRLDVFSENLFALQLYEKNNYERRGYADWRMGRFFLMEKNLMR